MQIIGEHVTLKRTGTDYRGPCPFHQGTHRNFSVSPKKGMYYCFVCHEAGDVFTFLQKRLGIDWPAAVRYVAREVGDRGRGSASRAAKAPIRAQPLWDVNAAVADWFRALLWDEDEGRAARDYLALREVTREVADRFGLGFAPRDPEAMRRHFAALGFERRSAARGRAARARARKASEPRPRFRDRLIFPILDAPGNTVGFGGRLLGPGEPKYLNSAESPVFSKGKLLYGLHMAKHAIRRDDRVLVVEGYFDVVRLVLGRDSSGSVAPLGTALTEAQAALLRRYANTSFLLYDSDKRGTPGHLPVGRRAAPPGLAVQVVTLPDGEDPDTFVERHGGCLAARSGDAIDVFERKFSCSSAPDVRRPQKKRRALDRLLPTIRATQRSAHARHRTCDPHERSRRRVARGVQRELAATRGARPPDAAPRARPSAPRRRALGSVAPRRVSPRVPRVAANSRSNTSRDTPAASLVRVMYMSRVSGSCVARTVGSSRSSSRRLPPEVAEPSGALEASALSARTGPPLRRTRWPSGAAVLLDESCRDPRLRGASPRAPTCPGGAARRPTGRSP